MGDTPTVDPDEVSIGLAILNVVGTAILTRLGSGWTGTSRRLRFVPIMLLAAVLASVASRWTGMDHLLSPAC